MELPERFHGGYRLGLVGGGIASPFVTEIGAGAGDHFAVEDLLDFSKDGGGGGGEEEDEDAAASENSDGSSPPASAVGVGVGVAPPESSNSTLSTSGAAAGDGCLSSDFCEPAEELAELEWLSNFVEDSFSSEDQQKLKLISGIAHPAAAAAWRKSAAEPAPCRFPVKARSKRSLASFPCSWSSRFLVLSNSGDAAPPVPKKPARKVGVSAAAGEGRRCQHCGSEKTPQWRAGPHGPKTLCNACGVRYKSGRLVPEYRPAASPTFSLAEHSNSHRKVLEMRRQKELEQQQQQQQQQ